MSRRVKVRTDSTFARDIEMMNHLRTALIVDDSLDVDTVRRITGEIDTVVSSISALRKALPKSA